MSMAYSPKVGSTVVSARRQLMNRIDLDPDKIPLMDATEDGEIPQDSTEPNPDEPQTVVVDAAPVDENVGYSPAFANFSSPTSGTNRDITDMDKSNPTDDPLLKTHEDEDSILVPSAVVDYYNEAALSTKKRNKLPDSEFGLPRLRAYPLNDEKHVRLAIQMFGHCKDPEDRNILAKNIFKKVKEFNMEVTIGKTSALYDYAPKSLQESTAVNALGTDADGAYIPLGKRTKAQVVREHLNLHSLFYNSLFFGDEYLKSLKAMEAYSFLDYFYPSFKTTNLYTRVSTAIGGLGRVESIYQHLGIRAPLSTEFNTELGWCDPASLVDFDIDVETNYDTEMNWFKVSLKDNYVHLLYCLRLYSIVGDIMLNPGFETSHLTEKHIGLLTDWSQRVCYHWDLMCREDEFSVPYMMQAQYLYDLMWDPHDNPFSHTDISANILAMVNKMVSGRNMIDTMNESTELISKEQCAGYMVHELGLDDDIFLLPGTLEYPIIDKTSVKMAVDNICRVPHEQIKEYTTNLNRKYRELGCTFTIPVDHPYAKYAVGFIDLNRILTEAETAVQDDGTSASPTDRATQGQPWYRRVDITGTLSRDLLKDDETGATDKRTKSPDYTRDESLF